MPCSNNSHTHVISVNDTHGHLAGDDVLREAGKRLLSSVRAYDYVGRYGGEEFLVLLNNCHPAHALARAEQICRSIAGTPVQTSNGAIPITMSFGLLMPCQWRNFFSMPMPLSMPPRRPGATG